MSKPLSVMCVFGTRPDAVKMAPVVRALRARPGRFRTRVVVTGQHREQLDQVLRAFCLEPDRDLAIMQHGQTLAQITTRALEGLDAALEADPVDAVLAQGDTTTTFVAALAAFYRKVAFGHVEAGLRTADLYNPFPEEANRRLAAVVTRWHFAPTPDARANLLREGVPEDRIWVTGNTGIDALLSVAAQAWQMDDPVLRAVMEAPERLVLVTAHRRENWGQPLAAICRAVRRLAAENSDCRFVYALHRNPVVREVAHRELDGIDRIHLVEPPDYVPFVKLMQRSTLILTDSGGVQEEAPSLGVPVLVLRTTTERPEGVTAGVARMVGADEEAIVAHGTRLLRCEADRLAMARAVSPYGDGRAAERIADVLATSPAGE